MTPRIRKITAIVSASALVGGAGLGAAQAATAAKDRSTSTSRQAPDERRGPSSADLAKIAAALDVTTAQLRSALDASRPAKPAAGEQPKGDRGAGRATALATALGVDVAKVQEILDANRPARPTAAQRSSGARPAKPDQTKLVAALAQGLDLDTTTVEAAFAKVDAAHRAEHDARHTAMYAALAEALDKTTAQVQAAFEANRPAKPGR